jgi:hypothetical protein
MGPKKLEWMPIANRAASNRGMLCSRSPAAPPSMIKISAFFTTRMMRALSIESASCPASAENRKKGRMKRPPATALNVASFVSSL